MGVSTAGGALPRKTDVVVVGAGAQGASALAREGPTHSTVMPAPAATCARSRSASTCPRLAAP